jgi:hypothetical protein
VSSLGVDGSEGLYWLLDGLLDEGLLDYRLLWFLHGLLWFVHGLLWFVHGLSFNGVVLDTLLTAFDGDVLDVLILEHLRDVLLLGEVVAQRTLGRNVLALAGHSVLRDSILRGIGLSGVSV